MSNLGNYVNHLVEANKGEQVFIAFVFVGLLVKVLLGGSAPASATIWAYFIIIFSIIGLIFLRIDTTKNDMEVIKEFFQPLLLLVIVLLWSISLNFRYFKEINSRTVPEQYFKWSRASTVLICAIIFFSILSLLSAENSGQFTMYNYLLIVFNLIVVGIQQVILDSFTVDG